MKIILGIAAVAYIVALSFFAAAGDELSLSRRSGEGNANETANNGSLLRHPAPVAVGWPRRTR